MSAKLPVVVNRSGGKASSMGDDLGPKIEAAFAAACVTIDLHLVVGEAMTETIKALSSAPAIAIGGGDGSLGGAAAILAKSGTTLGILPLGTRNHLAKQLDIPTDLDSAAKVIAAGRSMRIDLGSVGDKVFVNNAAIGTYPRLVRERDDSGLPKWLATIPAAWFVLKRNDHRHLDLGWPDGNREIVTPMLFVGNNHYALHGGNIGERERLDDGTLSIYAVARRGRLALIVFALRALFGRADAQRDFDALDDVAEFLVDGPGKGVDVALDGEVMRLDLPLKFASRPRALEVFAPMPPKRTHRRSRLLSACRTAARTLSRRHDLDQRYPPCVPRLFRRGRACPRRLGAAGAV